MTLLWALRSLVFAKAASASDLLRIPKLRIVAAGCSHRLERRILEQTNYFNELQKYLPHSEIELCMVGPEMCAHLETRGTGATHQDLVWHHESAAYRWATWQGTLQGFLTVRDIAMRSCAVRLRAASRPHWLH